jgi:hypothetical protein
MLRRSLIEKNFLPESQRPIRNVLRHSRDTQTELASGGGAGSESELMLPALQIERRTVSLAVFQKIKPFPQEHAWPPFVLSTRFVRTLNARRKSPRSLMTS